MMKKIISIVSVIFILLSVFTACTDTEEQESTSIQKGEKVESSVLTLPYSTNDSLNPYLCETSENSYIAALVYESLFTVNADFTVNPILARSYKPTNLLIKVTIKTDVKFSNNSNLTAQDVINSFNLAKESPNYSQSLSNFTTATAHDSTTVVFTMEKLKVNAVSCLDFPIVKVSGEKLYGTGNYMINYETLVVNKNSATASSVRNQKIVLKELPKGEGLYNSIEVGSVSAYYDDLSSGTVTPVTANMVSIPTNNLVYLGFNASEGEQLADKNVRKAISLAIDRENIVSSCFQTQATATTLPFNPQWKSAPGIDESALTSNQQNAEAILKKSGYERNYLETYYKGESVLNLTLVESKKNAFKTAMAQAVATDLEKIGIDVTVSELESTDFETAVTNGNFDIYIGEVKQTNDMSLSPFFAQGNILSVGVDKNSSSAKACEAYENGTKTLKDFIKMYNLEIPFAAICYRKGILYYTKELADNVNGTYKSVYSNINSWHFNKSY